MAMARFCRADVLHWKLQGVDVAPHLRVVGQVLRLRLRARMAVGPPPWGQSAPLPCPIQVSVGPAPSLRDVVVQLLLSGEEWSQAVLWRLKAGDLAPRCLAAPMAGPRKASAMHSTLLGAGLEPHLWLLLWVLLRRR